MTHSNYCAGVEKLFESWDQKTRKSKTFLTQTNSICKIKKRPILYVRWQINGELKWKYDNSKDIYFTLIRSLKLARKINST